MKRVSDRLWVAEIPESHSRAYRASALRGARIRRVLDHLDAEKNAYAALLKHVCRAPGE